jgi:hypothetical protein
MGPSRYLSTIQLLIAAIVYVRISFVKLNIEIGFYKICWLKRIVLAQKMTTQGQMISMPRKCRVLQSFEPAFAGGSRPRNAALAQAYRVISIGVRDPKCRCWLKTRGATSRTLQGQLFLYHKRRCNGREKLIADLKEVDFGFVLCYPPRVQFDFIQRRVI